MILRLLFLLLAFPVGATVFQKQSVNQQIKEADGVVIGHFLKSKTIELEDGSLATQMFFKMNKEYGLQSELFGMDEVIIHYPGGKLGDRNVKIEGVPTFMSGENVALMIKSREDRYWGLNLGFGTFRVVNYGNEKILVNSVFPEDPKVGQVNIDEFEKIVKTIKGSSLKVVMSQYPIEKDQQEAVRSPASENEGQIRSIASTHEHVENTREEVGIHPLWLIMFLAVMGGLFRLTRHKEAK